MLEKLFVTEIEVGVANLDRSPDEGDISTHAVCPADHPQEPGTGQARQLLLVYDSANIPQVADALRRASERAR